MEVTLILVSAVVVGLTELIKKFTDNIKIVLVATLVMSIVMIVIAMPMLGIDSWRVAVITGLVVALQAMGLYSGGKAIKNN